jgi:hypothetical protein
MLIETEKTSRTERPGRIVLDPYDQKNLDTLRRLRDRTPEAAKAG